MAVAVEVLVQAAREFSTMAAPCEELGIDPWDVPFHCPFHGFVKACACFPDEDENFLNGW